MKKVLHLLFFLFSCTWLHAISDNTCVVPAQKLAHEISETMEYLYVCLAYWQDQKHSPYSYFFGKNPSKWFWGKYQNEELDDHIQYLKNALEKEVCHLGKLHTLLQKIASTTHQDEINALYQKLNDTLQEFLRSSNTKNNINLYKKQVIKQLGIHNLPSHFTRHWIQYSAFGLTALVASIYWSKNSNDITAFMHKTGSSAKLFWQENVKSPIQNIIDIFYKTHIDKQVISDDKIHSQENLIKNMIIEYFHNRQADKGYLARYFEDKQIAQHKYSDQDIIAMAENAVRTGIIPNDILQDYAHESANPVKNLISPAGKILSIFMLKVHCVELDGYKIVKEIETIKAANLINLQLMAIIPALVMGYLGYKATKTYLNIYNPWHKKQTEIKTSLDKLEQHINTYNYPNAIIDERAHGYIAYWVYHLKSLSSYIPIAQKNRFEELLDSINDCTQTIGQKLVILNQIIRMVV